MSGKLLTSAILVFVLTYSCATADLAPPPPPAQAMIFELQSDATRGNANLKLGQHLLVHLQAQLGTGYDWALTSAASRTLRALGDGVLNSGPGQPGGFQTREFEFVAYGEGTVDLTFAYRRSWEKGQPPAKSLALHVVIGPA